MSKATLIEFCRDLLLSDEAMVRYKTHRDDAVARWELTRDERLSLLNDDFAAIHRRGVPLELLFQVILLVGLNPREYMQKLHAGLNYRGPGLITADTASSGDPGSWTPPPTRTRGNDNG